MRSPSPTLLIAEAVSLTGGEALAILAVLAVVGVVALVCLIGGCFWAYRAGQGRTGSQVAAGIAAAFEVGVMLLGIGSWGSLFTVVPLLALVVQAGLFFLGRSASPTDAPPAQ